MPGEANLCVQQQEAAILKRLEEDCEELLARCFENYYALSENAPGGILDGGVGAAESPAPALAPAVELAGESWVARFGASAFHDAWQLLSGVLADS